MKNNKYFKEMIDNKSFIVGFIIFSSVLIIAIFAGKISPFSYDGINISDALLPPGDKYFFGSDQYGRDIFSRIIYGSRITIKVGLIVVAIEGFIGVSLGLLAGYFGGVLDLSLI